MLYIITVIFNIIMFLTFATVVRWRCCRLTCCRDAGGGIIFITLSLSVVLVPDDAAAWPTPSCSVCSGTWKHFPSFQLLAGEPVPGNSGDLHVAS